MAKKSTTKKPAAVSQSFTFTAPLATSVQLVGDFTHWQQSPIQMKKGRGGIWQAKVTLPPGEHHYRFLVDGKWHDDPQCTVRVSNPYGGQNSVRSVG